MDYFTYRHGELYAEDVPVKQIAETYGTPCYIYSRATLERHWLAFDRAFGDRPHLIHYAVKANSNLAVLNVLARLGTGFDIVSLGELERVIAAGGDPSKIVFSGVGKRTDEIVAALQRGIGCFNIEVSEELDRIAELAQYLNCTARIALRVNPDVDAQTHPYISTGLKENKFGLDSRQALENYRRALNMPHVQIVGIACHIGSQLTQIAPFLDALACVLELVDQLQQEGITLQHIDLGGGLGIRYRDETPPSPAEYVQALLTRLKDRPFAIHLEPGRAIAGNAGILVTRVEYLKTTLEKNFAIVDAAMNDLLRPALYDAWQTILPVKPRNNWPILRWDIVGPVCETGDFLGKARELALMNNDLLAIYSAGAYGFSMSSQYNSRPRAAEMMVDGNHAHLIRHRESLNDLWRGEEMLPEEHCERLRDFPPLESADE